MRELFPLQENLDVLRLINSIDFFFEYVIISILNKGNEVNKNGTMDIA